MTNEDPSGSRNLTTAGTVVAGTVVGVANAATLYGGAVAAANAAGIYGAAATSTALASLGGGAVAAGGGGMAAGIGSIAFAAAWPAALVGAAGLGGYLLFKRLRRGPGDGALTP